MNEVPDVELDSGETGQQLVPQLYLAMYKLSDENVTTPTTWEETEYFASRGLGAADRANRRRRRVWLRFLGLGPELSLIHI